MLSANRGLCGGYNGNVLRLGLNQLKQLQADAARRSAWKSPASGAFRPFASGKSTSPSDSRSSTTSRRSRKWKPWPIATWKGTSRAASTAWTSFTRSSRASGRQFAVAETLLPLAHLEGAGRRSENPTAIHVQYEFLPSAASIVDEVVPASFKVKLFKCFLDAAVSEQIARRVAMKNATENAESMIGSLSIAYNRARQGQITGELLEIIGGAEALNK